MFTIKQERTFDWPVRVVFPAEDGRRVEQRFTATFRLGRLADLRERLASLGRGDLGRDLLADIWVGWDGIADEDGNPVTFDEEIREQLLDDVFVLNAVVRALADAIDGAREKNSRTPPAFGRGG